MALARLRKVFSGFAPNVAWGVVSALGLWVAKAIDPYVFGAAAFPAAGISVLLAIVALLCGWRAFVLALLAGVPTLASFQLLSTYSWA